MRIDGAITLITGASEGIGAACAREFRRRGAKLALLARSTAKLNEVADPNDLVITADLFDPSVPRSAVDRTIERFGRIDILINNAGVGLASPAQNADLAEARRLFELNFFAPLALAQCAIPSMKAQRSGMIVNVGSVAGKVAMPWFSLYSATKFALGALTNGLRMELRNDGIRTMLVCPGFVRTDFHYHTIGGPPPGAERRGRPAEITADECAVAIADGVARDARTVVAPRSAWLLVAAARLFPATVDATLAAMKEKRK